MADEEAPPIYDEKQNENSKSYSIKFDHYDETDADPNALDHLQKSLRNVNPQQKQQEPKDLPKQGTNYESMYNKNKTADTTNTGSDNGEQKMAQHIEMNVIKAVDISNNNNTNANANAATMPNMQQILGELKLSLRGQYLELDVNGEIVHCKINNISETIKSDSNANTGKPTSRLSSVQQTNTAGPLTKRAKRKEKVENLVKDSTNRWLYMNDIDPDGEENCCDACNRCSNGCVNKFIAIAVILIQIVAYITITYFLMHGIYQEQVKRSETCYGPNCKNWDFVNDACMSLSTGALISVMLIGFLWADVINALGTCKYNMFASIMCLLELVTAIVCGFLTATYTPNEFDAISGAIGILFVHDLDERVFASMAIISRRKKTALIKKLIAVLLWIVLSIAISIAVSCTYNSGSILPDGTCLQTQYQCYEGVTECVWNGFVCNGIKDCDDGSDEGALAGCNYESFLLEATAGKDYPANNFMCLSTGKFLVNTTRCDGVLDCEDGSDEGRKSNCTDFVRRKKCGEGLTKVTDDDEWHQTWSGQFKCNNGQCIDAQYACDGEPHDCVDGSDEYPAFDQTLGELLISRCPYSKLIHCESSQALCKIDGKCIHKSKLCDGIQDCADGQDEEGCEFSCLTQRLINKQEFQCGGKIADINGTHIILFTSALVDEFGSGPNGTFTAIPYQNDTQLLTEFVGEITKDDTGACIPEEWRCDGLIDCIDGSDEQLCTLFSCDPITEYQCPTSGICIHQEALCNWVPDCMDGSDEVEKNCEEFGRSFDSSATTACENLGFSGTGYILCPDEPVCFQPEWACDGYCDCYQFCHDENAAYGWTNCDQNGYTPAPQWNGGSNTQSVNIDTWDQGIINCFESKGDYIDVGKRHSYSFTIGGGYTNVKFSTCNGGTDFDTELYLFDNAGTNTIIHNDDQCALQNGVASTIEFNNNFAEYGQGNNYKIVVAGFSDTSNGDYNLTVSCSI